MKRAVIYGAGNIGRGFVGALCARSGYAVTFVDVVEPVVRALRARRGYSVRVVEEGRHEDLPVTGVNALHGNDAEAVADAIAECDIMATAVGANALKLIAQNIALGVRRRLERGGAPLNILLCENLLDADKVLASLVKQHLTSEEQALFDRQVGLVEVSVGRMVPVQTDEMRDGDPLRVCVERYGFLPVDRDAFKGEIPEVAGMVPCSPFGLYIQRKLYIHNMGHAVCAYLGLWRGMTYIFEAVGNPEILLICGAAMRESMEALCLAYGAPPLEMLRHIDDLLNRFANGALRDTCARVGGDSERKLAPADRLIGAARLCLRHGVVPAHIAIGIAAAVHRHLSETGRPQSSKSAADALKTLSGVEEGEELAGLTLQMYGGMLREERDFTWLRIAARDAKRGMYDNIL